MSRLNAIAAGLAAVFIWAVMPCIVKLAGPGVEVSSFLVVRFGFSALVVGMLAPRILRRARRVPLWAWGALLADLGANYYSQTVAMQGLPASWYIVIFSLNPVLALLLLRTRLSRALAGGIAVASAGTWMFVTARDLTVEQDFALLVPLVIGMLTWVAYTWLIQRFQKHYTDLEVTALTHLIGFAAVAVIWLGKGMPIGASGLPVTLSAGALGLGTIAAYYCFSYCLRRVPTFGVVSQYLEPVFGILAAQLLFQESLTWLQYAGAAAIVLGVARIPSK